jgi:ribosomal protein S18 acetylase RimI-like enzyme
VGTVKNAVKSRLINRKMQVKMNITIKKCTADNLEELILLSKETFYQTFAAQNTVEDMETYLETAFSKDKLYRELCDHNTSFFFLYADESLAGYLKLNDYPSQTDVNDENSLEIERIYVLKDFQGLGLGRYLMEYSIKTAADNGKNYVWLGVWEKNEKALRFYKSNGFYRIGEHSFVIGNDVQTDYIMRKDL